MFLLTGWCGGSHRCRKVFVNLGFLSDHWEFSRSDHNWWQGHIEDGAAQTQIKTYCHPPGKEFTLSCGFSVTYGSAAEQTSVANPEVNENPWGSNLNGYNRELARGLGGGKILRHALSPRFFNGFEVGNFRSFPWCYKLILLHNLIFLCIKSKVQKFVQRNRRNSWDYKI